MGAHIPDDEQPSPTLQVRTDNDQTVFHIGELIGLQLSYAASGKGYQVSTASDDRSGRLGIEHARQPSGSARRILNCVPAPFG